MKCLARSLIPFAFCASALGGEPMAVSGDVEASPGGSFLSEYFLRDPLEGGIVAGLRDPRLLLMGVDSTVTLQVEETSQRDVNGVPILEVTGVLPDFFAQPSVWRWAQRGPAAFSRVGMDAQPKDFAGIPFNSARAYRNDFGIERVRVNPPQPDEPPAPLEIMLLMLDSRQITFEFPAYAGLTYELQTTDTIDETPATVSTFTPDVDGPAVLSAPAPSGGSLSKFFLIRALAPLTL